MLFLSCRIQRMFSSELFHIFLYKFLEPRWFIIERSNLCISRIANFILILQMNLYHEVIHAKYVGQAIVLMRMQSMHGITNANISKLWFVKATLIPGISIVQHVVYLLIPILGSPIKCAKDSIQNCIHLIASCTHQFI